MLNQINPNISALNFYSLGTINFYCQLWLAQWGLPTKIKFIWLSLQKYVLSVILKQKNIRTARSEKYYVPTTLCEILIRQKIKK